MHFFPTVKEFATTKATMGSILLFGLCFKSLLLSSAGVPSIGGEASCDSLQFKHDCIALSS